MLELASYCLYIYNSIIKLMAAFLWHEPVRLQSDGPLARQSHAAKNLVFYEFPTLTVVAAAIDRLS